MSEPYHITLSDHHIACIPLADGPMHDPRWRMLEDDDLDRLADRLTQDRPRPIPIFAYGSLIWNPGFSVGARRRGTALGWHRSFSIQLDHFRGSPERPGLMLALASGGRCDGLVMDIAPEAETESLRALLRRELVAHELSANACWITVRTDQGVQDALTFYADPVGTRIARLPIAEQARRLARAAGAGGTGAEYLLRTVRGLAEHGIHDDYIWTLQQQVAAEIEAITGNGPATP